MIDIYDGNNVMRRSMEQGNLSPRMSLRQRYEHSMARPVGTQIWVWDGRHHNARRQAIYPQYKMNRVPAPEDIYAQIRLWRDVLRHGHATQIEVHGWEADDVIGTLVRDFAKRGVRVKVHTNDMDYGQIAHLCDLNGVNMKGIDPQRIALFKAMNGDDSDNIDGIPGIGPKRWEELEPHWDEIERAIIAGEPANFLRLPFKPAVKTWLTSQENIDLLQAMLTVTHFENVPSDEIEGGIIEGVPNREAAVELLGRYFL